MGKPKSYRNAPSTFWHQEQYRYLSPNWLKMLELNTIQNASPEPLHYLRTGNLIKTVKNCSSNSVGSGSTNQQSAHISIVLTAHDFTPLLLHHVRPDTRPSPETATLGCPQTHFVLSRQGQDTRDTLLSFTHKPACYVPQLWLCRTHVRKSTAGANHIPFGAPVVSTTKNQTTKVLSTCGADNLVTYMPN